ncbi:hypothetical protein K1T71_007068 [Dendrolimus kikuchii]|uniref:Uncharacterized protein n=1 Tax=Dendrolimus kikuchii TaxID=765133 RepID=A0ACC1CZB5_9NEOP|nr:hypothetical protein K1T71_007068 [Dendrolimus kikuchii]
MTFGKIESLNWNTFIGSNGHLIFRAMTENRKRSREDDTCEFMPLSKRINNLHIRKLQSLCYEKGKYIKSDEDSDMNFATFSAVGSPGAHFVTTGGQLPVAKLQQNVQNNGTLSQVVGMVGGVTMGDGGVQYMRSLDGGATLQAAPQLISIPIALPGSKPGDPQQTVQIQVLNPSLLQAQQQPKYQMQIPIQGFQQGAAVLTLAYSPETSEASGVQLVGQGGLGEGLQVLSTMPQEMQMLQQSQTQNDKEQMQNNMHQVFITPNNQHIIINNLNQGNKSLNNNNNEEDDDVVIKEECDDNTNDDESSQGTEASETSPWQISSNQQDLVKYLSQLPPQQAQTLPVSLQQFLKLNPTEAKKAEVYNIEIEVPPAEEKREEPVINAVINEDGTVRIKKKKKYKKKPPKPARPRPGSVVIATASDGTPIFCCPECQMAYPDKEQLEIHLVVHKIERRFICGICGAGLKRKEHLERHKLGHNPERPYVCSVCHKGFKRREHLNLHTVIHTGVKTEMCTECGKGFYRKDHLRKHTRSHEVKRLRDEAAGEGQHLALNKSAQMLGQQQQQQPQPSITTTTNANTLLPEITIHVPTSANMHMPIQINIPQHVVSSLAAAQQQQAAAQAQASAHTDTHSQLEALLANHT